MTLETGLHPEREENVTGTNHLKTRKKLASIIGVKRKQNLRNNLYTVGKSLARKETEKWLGEL